jgi:hypothetical protein
MRCAGADMMGVTDRLHDWLGEVADIDALPRANTFSRVGRQVTPR